MTLLALAKKVYPNRPWVEVFGETVVEQYSPINGREAELFTPARNPTQLLDVLCWLMAQDKNNALRSDVLLYVVNDGTGWSKRAEYHNGTPASLAAAIVKAAVRVAGEEA